MGRCLTGDIRASLEAKLERLLARPLIATVLQRDEAEESGDAPSVDPVFRSLQVFTRNRRPNFQSGGSAWTENAEDGSCRVEIEIDYLGDWREREKEVLQTVTNARETPVTFLTEEQKVLLERSPREFIGLMPQPETADLNDFETEKYGGAERVTALTLSAPPLGRSAVRYVAIVPNLVQIQRQLAALEALALASPEGPLAPLRALVGMDAPDMGPSAQLGAAPAEVELMLAHGEQIDEFQRLCVEKSISTPHFAVIQGPPGSGKTTVISCVVRNAVERGARVLVVSPTHVAVDNVVEKLAPSDDAKGDDLAPHTLPVRYAARNGKLSEHARGYWVGSRSQLRGATVARRLQRRLEAALPIASTLFAREDTSSPGLAPLSAAIARAENVICGTPIGILSYDAVKQAPPGSFDLLVVDEVSKMTLPEFLAIAIKAKRWVLVGDPKQLPPFSNSEENGTTLDDVIDPLLELVCSVGAVLEKCRPDECAMVRMVVATNNPAAVTEAVRRHLRAVGMSSAPRVGGLGDDPVPGIVVCEPQAVDGAFERLSQMNGRDRMGSPRNQGTVGLLVERGLRIKRPEFGDGHDEIQPYDRAQSRWFATSFEVYHALPWSRRAAQKLTSVSVRKGLPKYLPSPDAVDALRKVGVPVDHAECMQGIALRYAINAVSVYDWLTGIPERVFDVPPLCDLPRLQSPHVVAAVRPYVGTLKRQYRMHASLSRVPRELFYFGEALHDGKATPDREHRVGFMQVDGSGGRGGEENEAECEVICEALRDLARSGGDADGAGSIMVITPYTKQRHLLLYTIERARKAGEIGSLKVDVLTLDSCQGREAEYVFISLVRSRATQFLDMPNRWNVALTRAKRAMFLVGDIDSYLQEARKASEDPRRFDPQTGQEELKMSLLARIIDKYDRQINGR
jgi:DNA polymerase III delta prime subunit